MFEWSDEEQRLMAIAPPLHPPKDEDIPMLDTDPASRARRCLDMVINRRRGGRAARRYPDNGYRPRCSRLHGLRERHRSSSASL